MPTITEEVNKRLVNQFLKKHYEEQNRMARLETRASALLKRGKQLLSEEDERIENACPSRDSARDAASKRRVAERMEMRWMTEDELAMTYAWMVEDEKRQGNDREHQWFSRGSSLFQEAYDETTPKAAGLLHGAFLSDYKYPIAIVLCKEDTVTIDCMVTRYTQRGKGIGVEIVRRALSEAKRRRQDDPEALYRVDAMPGAFSFWRHCGFENAPITDPLAHRYSDRPMHVKLATTTSCAGRPLNCVDNRDAPDRFPRAELPPPEQASCSSKVEEAAGAGSQGSARPASSSSSEASTPRDTPAPSAAAPSKPTTSSSKPNPHPPWPSAAPKGAGPRTPVQLPSPDSRRSSASAGSSSAAVPAKGRPPPAPLGGPGTGLSPAWKLDARADPAAGVTVSGKAAGGGQSGASSLAPLRRGTASPPESSHAARLPAPGGNLQVEGRGSSFPAGSTTHTEEVARRHMRMPSPGKTPPLQTAPSAVSSSRSTPPRRTSGRTTTPKRESIASQATPPIREATQPAPPKRGFVGGKYQYAQQGKPTEDVRDLAPATKAVARGRGGQGTEADRKNSPSPGSSLPGTPLGFGSSDARAHHSGVREGGWVRPNTPSKSKLAERHMASGTSTVCMKAAQDRFEKLSNKGGEGWWAWILEGRKAATIVDA